MRRVILAESVAGGMVAWSECVAQTNAGYSHETVDSCWNILENELIPFVLNQSFESPRHANALIAERAPDDRMARATIEMAVWALESMKENLSLAALLSRECDSNARREVETGIALGMHSSIEELADRCARARDEGYRRIKVKIEPGRDVAYASAALRAVENEIPVTADANASYSDSDRSLLQELDTLGLAMIEQPLGADDLSGSADLQSLLNTPICLDESITSANRAAQMIELGSARIVNLKPGRVGGFTEALAVHETCKLAGIPIWCGGMLETGIGRAYNVALAALPNFTLPGDLSPSARYWSRDVITDPWTMNDGRVRVPLDRPGIGVDVDVQFIDSLTTRTKTFSSR